MGWGRGAERRGRGVAPLRSSSPSRRPSSILPRDSTHFFFLRFLDSFLCSQNSSFIFSKIFLENYFGNFFRNFLEIDFPIISSPTMSSRSRSPSLPPRRDRSPHGDHRRSRSPGHRSRNPDNREDRYGDRRDNDGRRRRSQYSPRPADSSATSVLLHLQQQQQKQLQDQAASLAAIQRHLGIG